MVGMVRVFGLVLVVQLAAASMLLLSPEFRNFEDIPAKFACDAYFPDNLLGPSPPLEWYRTPEKTQSFILMVDDVLSETGNVHWLVSNIPRDITQLPTDASRFAMPPGAREYRNSIDGDFGFASLCPIGATHTFRFRLYAMRVPNVNLTDIALPYSVKVVEEQLAAMEQDIIYVATLVGKMFVEPAPSHSFPSPSSSPKPHYVEPEPIPQRRYVKPSEILRNRRPHNNPRPLNSTSLDEICRRYRENNSSLFHAQLCKDTEMSPEGVKRLNELIRNLQPRQNVDKVEQGGAEQSVAKAVKKHVVVAAQLKISDTTHNHESDVLEQPKPKKLSKEDADLIDWDCASSSSSVDSALRLRSPVLDSCSTQGLPVLTSEFACDLLAPTEPRVSPPLTWRLQDNFNNTRCTIRSFVLMLEDVQMQKIHWLVTDIPDTTNYLDMDLGLAETADPANGITQLNSFKTAAYIPPCVHEGGPKAFRFHLIGVSARKTHLANTYALSSSQVKEQLAENCAESTLDFAVLAP